MQMHRGLISFWMFLQISSLNSTSAASEDKTSNSGAPMTFAEHLSLGDKYLRDWQFEAAKNEYAECFRLDPDNPALHRARRQYHLAVVESLTATVDQIRNSLEKIEAMLQVNNDDPEMLYAYGRGKEALKDYETAGRAYAAAMNKNPHAHRELIPAYERVTGRRTGLSFDATSRPPDTASGHQTHKSPQPAAPKPAPQKDLAMYVPVEAAILAKDFDKADIEIEAILEKNASDEQAYFLRGILYEKKGDLLTAAANYRMAMHLKHRSAGAHLRRVALASIGEQRNDTPTAHNWIGQAAAWREACRIESINQALSKQSLSPKLYGIGISLRKTGSTITISATTQRAARTLKIGDEIVEVAGRATNDRSLEQVAQLIKGERSTPVILTIRRGGSVTKVLVMREVTAAKPIEAAHTLDGEIGYIHVPDFDSEELPTAIVDQLMSWSPKSLILDLRDTTGTSVANISAVADLFLKKGEILSVVDSEFYKSTVYAKGSHVLNMPTILLVNRYSDASALLFAATLQENGRAVIVGESARASDLIQSTFKLEDDSYVKISVARCLTPSGHSLRFHGLIPDVQVNLTDEEEKAGNGPWWKHNKSFNRASLKDKQLLRALGLSKTSTSR